MSVRPDWFEIVALLALYAGTTPAEIFASCMKLCADQRQLDDILLRNDLTERRGFALEQRSSRGYRHLFRDITDRKDHVYATVWLTGRFMFATSAPKPACVAEMR